MGIPTGKVRGSFMTATCGDEKPLLRCGRVEVNHRGNITLPISGTEDDLYLEVNLALAREIISRLEIGARIKLGLQDRHGEDE